MLEFPSILGFQDLSAKIGEHVFAFNKLDGSNIRAEWTKKNGWSKFGSRTRLLDKSDPILGGAIDLFTNKYAEPLERVFNSIREYKERGKATVFMEYFGPSSFAGTHVQDEVKNLVLFDVSIHKLGFLDPREFIKNFGHLEIPELIYEGKLTKEFIDNVRNGNYPVFEGVICKGGHKHTLWMRKIKTLAYLDQLKNRFKEDWEKYI